MVKYAPPNTAYKTVTWFGIVPKYIRGESPLDTSYCFILSS